MNTRFRFRVFAAAAVFVFAGAYAVAAYASHSWGGYHWARTANPFTLALGDNVSSLWDAHLGAASADWSVSGVLDAVVASGRSNPKNCRPTSGRIEVCSGKYGNNGWLGVAQVWVSGSHITQGTVKLNDTYFAGAKYNTPVWRQFVMCQEIGHTFGLDHQDENFSNANLGTCMDYTNDPARDDGAGNNLHPNAHDYGELEDIYAHLDIATSTSSAASASSRAFESDASDSSEWGEVVRKADDGRPSLYARALGKKEKVFTFVIWAD